MEERSDDPAEGDGVARVPLSEVITAVLDELDKSAADLASIRHRLRQRELPEELEVDEDDLPRPSEHARKVAADLETYATAPRNASGHTGDAPTDFDV
jgi:hypothetical protein